MLAEPVGEEVGESEGGKDNVIYKEQHTVSSPGSHSGQVPPALGPG